ncbi:hypothetical protein [Halonotius aquaticus]|uniref:hypothetical protein n=1 Tax=Halonotius aquaticus TaxID=2216978 RepID=UPI001058844B|nr:hypothetical protein [Halonotius aquaticus]
MEQPGRFEKYGPDYIIAGTNNYDPFKVEHVTEPAMQKSSYQAIEQYTTTGIPHNQLFQNFPGDLEGEVRNPIDVWEDRNWN